MTHESTQLKQQLFNHPQYISMQRFGEDDPAYQASFFYEAGPFLMVVDLFEDDEGKTRISAESEMMAPDGEAHYIEWEEADTLEMLEAVFLSIWNAIQQGSTLYTT